MARDLEELISDLITFIACAGSQGCLLEEALDFVTHRQLQNPASATLDILPASRHRIHDLLWAWLETRPDVVISPSDEDGQPADGSGDRGHGAAVHNARTRISVPESARWEFLTGHTEDFKRVLPLEWQLLQGIAAAHFGGILQGDLCKATGQDKRSVPKRTDSLVRKGYITKRTTLARGTKTSKMWLRSLAPALEAEADDVDGADVQSKLPLQSLTSDLEPVPWHQRWTGPSMDYTAFTTTIMAITKQWKVIRIRHLKLKLGILGLRWHMKTMAKACRMLNMLGTIQYTAAKLGQHVYKDCIEFTRDLTPQDLCVLFAAGKRRQQPLEPSYNMDQDDTDGEAIPSSSGSDVSVLVTLPPWISDKPLATVLYDDILFFGTSGATNPDLISLSIGPFFSRFVSSLTNSLSSPAIQPKHLAHMQINGEHTRDGKISFYRYSVAHSVDTPAKFSPNASGSHRLGFSRKAPKKLARLLKLSGTKESFIGTTRRPSNDIAEIIAQASDQQNVHGQLLDDNSGPRNGSKLGIARGAPDVPHALPAESLQTKEEVGVGHDSALPNSVSIEVAQAEEERNQGVIAETRAVPASETRRSIAEKPESSQAPLALPSDLHEDGSHPNIPLAAGETDNPNMSDQNREGKTLDKATEADTHVPRRGRPPKGSRKAGGKGKADGKGRAVKSWTCEKCGRTWKNDIGLKYHLEKARVSCNINYDPSLEPAKRGPKPRSKYESLLSSIDGLEASSTNAEKETSHNGGRREVMAISVDDENLNPDRGHRGLSDWMAPTFGPTSAHTFKRPRKGLKAAEAATNPTSKQSGHSVFLRTGTTSAIRTKSFARRPTDDVAIDCQPTAAHFGIAQSLTDTLNDEAPRQSSWHHEAAQPSQSEELVHPIAAEGSRTSSSSDPNSAKTHPQNPFKTAISHLLEKSDGVVLGGDSLYRSVLSEISSVSTGLEEVTIQMCKRGIQAIIDDGTVKEHWHAFRTAAGDFTKCQVLSWSHIDPFSPACLTIVEAFKSQHNAAHEHGVDVTTKPQRSRRRDMRPDVAVLDAPVYAAQAVFKGSFEPGEGTTTRDRKRYPLGQGEIHMNLMDVRGIYSGGSSLQRDDAPNTSTLQSIIRPASELRAGSLPGQSRGEIVFLPPNTFLDEDENAVTAGFTVVSDELAVPGGQRFTVDPSCYVQNGSTKIISGSSGRWPDLEMSDFETEESNISMRGWLPDVVWHTWASRATQMAKQPMLRDAKWKPTYRGESEFRMFGRHLQRIRRLEADREKDFVNATPGAAGPHNNFVPIFGPEVAGFEAQRFPVWPDETPAGEANELGYFVPYDYSASSSDDEADIDPQLAQVAIATTSGGVAISGPEAPTELLATRTLTAVPSDELMQDQGVIDYDQLEADGWLLAAIMVIRVLFGGVDKAVDWGLLAALLPNTDAGTVQSFWAAFCSDQESYITSYTASFQQKFIAAYQLGEVPEINFDEPNVNDLTSIIDWTMLHVDRSGLTIPSRRCTLEEVCTTKEAAKPLDWRNDYFHIQSSVFTRFESATSEAGAVSLVETAQGIGRSAQVTDLVVVRSWIRSLCCAWEDKFSPQEVRSKFQSFNPTGTHSAGELLRRAIDQLYAERAIKKNPKMSQSKRPYQLSDTYRAVLEKMAHRGKYVDATLIKARMDRLFRQGRVLPVAYALDDGSAMAITNLLAAKRVMLRPLELPDIPYGFEPGTYESRKFPKQYYHFDMEVVPTERYAYNEDINTLRSIAKSQAPGGGSRGELPQWVDFSGTVDNHVWAQLLGSLCFVLATRGPMTTNALCETLEPLVELFEIDLMICWGVSVGLLRSLTQAGPVTVNEWWWLAISSISSGDV